MTDPTADLQSMPTRVPMRLIAIRFAARATHLYEFARADGSLLPAAEPGAHIGLHLPNGILRQYSLVTAASAPTSYTVGIKRDPHSRGGSSFVHDSFKVGMLIDVDLPRNNFPLNEDAEETVLIAGGIGITPVRAMVERLQTLGRNWHLYYSCRSREDAAFLDELMATGRVDFHFDEEAGCVLDLSRVFAQAPASAHLYCCGPTPMLAAFEAGAADRAADRVHVEYFTPKQAAATGGGYTVKLARSGRELPVGAGQTILGVLRDAGIDVSFSCEEGVCGACETGVIAGTPDHRDSVLSQSERASSRTMMICCSGSKEATLELDL